MLAELRQKSQITIPKEIIVKLGLSEGDKMIILVDVGHHDILKQFKKTKRYVIIKGVPLCYRILSIIRNATFPPFSLISRIPYSSRVFINDMISSLSKSPSKLHQYIISSISR